MRTLSAIGWLDNQAEAGAVLSNDALAQRFVFLFGAVGYWSCHPDDTAGSAR